MLLAPSEPSSPVRRALRLVSVVIGAAGGYLLYLGVDLLWGIVSLGSSRGPAGEAGLAVGVMTVLFGGAGVVFCALGVVLVAMAWAAFDVRAWRRGPARP